MIDNKIDVIFKGEGFTTDYINDFEIEENLERIVHRETSDNGFSLETLFERIEDQKEIYIEATEKKLLKEA